MRRRVKFPFIFLPIPIDNSRTDAYSPYFAFENI
jgi:hypothetical protein